MELSEIVLGIAFLVLVPVLLFAYRGRRAFPGPDRNTHVGGVGRGESCDGGDWYIRENKK